MQNHLRRPMIILALAFLCAAIAPAVRAADPPWLARGKSGMVAADSPEASQVGADILKAGGNAFDAAIATSLALTVCRPESTGIGGGGFLLAYVAREKRFIALDFRETAPACATPQRYAKLDAERGVGPSASIYGGNAVGVPGLVAGLDEIRKRFGTKSFAELAAPAIHLAEDGFVVDEHFRSACSEALDDYKKYPMLKSQCARLYERFLKDGKLPMLGEKFRRPAIADALRLIAKDGPSAFYDGPIADAIIKAVQQSGGGLTREDLRAYRVMERKPLDIEMHRFEITKDGTRPTPERLILMPPPSSGGICVGQILHLVYGNYQSTRCADRETVDFYDHWRIEVMKHAFADRARWLGDPGFVSVPVEFLLSGKHLMDLSDKACLGPFPDPQRYGTTTLPDDRGTSHFCVADCDGNLVAQTETVNGGFGSFVMTDPFDIVLNNQLDDFTTVPGKTNLFGLVQGERNLIGPGRRPLSSMSPTIFLRDGKPLLILGGSGGPRIITAVAQVLGDVSIGLTLESAMSRVRIHHQWQPDEIYFDRTPTEEWTPIIEALKKRGHKFSEKRKTAAVQAIQFLDDGTLVGASDPLKGGRPVGLP